MQSRLFPWKQEPQAIQLTWNKLTKSTLPAEIELYETTSNLNGSNFHAWYAIGDLSTGKVEVRVHIPSSPQPSTRNRCHSMETVIYWSMEDTSIMETIQE